MELTGTPFLKSGETTPQLMYHVVLALLPALGAAYYYFGLATLALVLSAVAGCLLAEYLFLARERPRTLLDGSALVTGLLLALTLPPGFPLWMAFLGGFVAIGLGKAIWGGLGQNVFNPALIGRAFLQAAFPTAITTWSPPDGRYFAFRGTNLALPLFQGTSLDTVTTATPLALLKFEHKALDWWTLLIGRTGGSLGETCALALLLGGLYLLWKKVIHWRIPVAVFLGSGLFSGALYLWNPSIYPSPWFTWLAGGMMLGTFFMATDLVTSPLTPKGEWIFGLGIGFLVVLIRVFGGLPEGMMYAILLMNSATPLLNRFFPTRVYGT